MKGLPFRFVIFISYCGRFNRYILLNLHSESALAVGKVTHYCRKTLMKADFLVYSAPKQYLYGRQEDRNF